MRNETIFRSYSTWMNRMAETEGRDIRISACFDDPTVWPYTIKRDYINDDLDSFEQLSLKISRADYERIKKAIAEHTDLATCKEEVDGYVCDGQSDSFTFSCDGFTKTVSGDSITTIGSIEAEGPVEKRGAAFAVYSAIKHIEQIITSMGISMDDFWG